MYKKIKNELTGRYKVKSCIGNLIFPLMIFVFLIGLSGTALASDSESHNAGDLRDPIYDGTKVSTYGPFLQTYKYVNTTGGNVKNGIAEIGDTLNFTIYAVNTGNALAHGVTVIDYLPEGFEYVPGSITYSECNGSNSSSQDCQRYSDWWNVNFPCTPMNDNREIICSFNRLRGAYEIECTDPGAPAGTPNKTINRTYFNYVKIEFEAIATNANTTLNESEPNQNNTVIVSGYHDEDHYYLIDYNESDFNEAGFNLSTEFGIDEDDDSKVRTDYVNLTILPNTTVSVTKDVSNMNRSGAGYHAEPGDYLNYTITITTTSAVPINIQVVDTLPIGFEPKQNYTRGDITVVTNMFCTDPYNENIPSNCTMVVTLNENGTGYIDLIVYVHSEAAEGACACQPGASGCACTGLNVNSVSINGTNEYNPGENITDNGTAPPVDIDKPHLDIRKESLTPYATPEDTVIYQITIRNTGDGTAYNIMVNDTLPDGWVFGEVIYSSPGCGGGVDSTIIGGDVSRVLFNTTNISAGETCTFRYNVTIPWNTPDGVYRNEIVMSFAIDGDNTTIFNTTTYANYNNYSDIMVSTNTELRVNKDVMNNTMFVPNNIITYRINVSNLGTNNIHNLTVLDLLPIWLNYTKSWACEEGKDCVNSSGCLANGTCGLNNSNIAVNYTTDGSICNSTTATLTGNTSTGQDVLWCIGNLSGQNYRIIYLQVRVTSPALDGSYLNKVEVMAQNSNNNSMLWKDVVDVIVARPHVEWEKVSLNTSVTPGDDITYRIHVQNTGKGTVNNIHIVDKLPDDFRYVGGSLNNSTLCAFSDGGADNVNQVTFTMSNLPGETECSFTFRAKVPQDTTAGSYINTIWGNYSDTGDTYYNVTNKTGGSTIVTTGGMNILVKKEVNDSITQPGDKVQFNITITNTGTEQLNVMVTDTLPQGFTPVVSDMSVSGEGTNNTQFSCVNIQETGDLIPQFVCTVNVTLNENAQGETSTVVVTMDNVLVTSEAPEGDNENKVVVEGTRQDNVPVLETDLVEVTVLRPHIDWEKISLTQSVTPGDNITYEIIIQNTGKGTARNVHIWDKLPDSFTYNSNDSLDCDSYTVNVTDGAGADPSGKNTVLFTINEFTGETGCSFTFNALVPQDTPAGGYINAIWGNYSVFEYFYNESNYSMKYYDISNDTTAYTYVTTGGDVVLVKKEVDDSIVQPGDKVQFNITITNTGTEQLNVMLTDTMPQGFVPVVFDMSVSGQGYNNTQFNCVNIQESGDLIPQYVCTVNVTLDGNAQGETSTVVVTMDNVLVTSEAPEGDNENKVLVEGVTDSGMPVLETDLVEVTVLRPHIDWEKISLTQSVTPGDNITYEIIIQNTGKGTARNVHIWDKLPDAFTYNSNDSLDCDSYTVNVTDGAGADPSGKNTVLFTINEFIGETGCSFTFNALVPQNTSAGGYINAIWGNYSVFEYFYNESNYSMRYYDISNDTTAYTYVTTGGMNILVKKEVNDTIVEPGDRVGFNITITNTGTEELNLMVTDTMPQGFDPSNATLGITNITGGAVNLTVLNCTTISSTDVTFQTVCSVDITIQGESKVVLSIDNVEVTSKAPEGDNENKVTVNGTRQDGIPVLETDLVEITVLKPGPLNGLEKLTLTDNVPPGGTATYKIRIINPGTGELHRIQIVEDLPLGFGETTGIQNIHTEPGSVCENATFYVDDSDPDNIIIIIKESNGVDNFTLPAGGVCEFTYDTDVDQQLPDGTYLNHITLYSTDKSGTPLVELESQAPVNVRSGVLLMSTDKTVNVSFAQPGDVIEYTLFMKNEGNNTITEIEITDQLSKGVIYLNYTASFATEDITGVVRKFDMGTQNSPVMSGYNRVTHLTNESDGMGYGWYNNSGLNSVNTTSSNALLRDFVNATIPRTFYVNNLSVNTTYRVTIRVNDSNNHTVNISANGNGTDITGVVFANGLLPNSTTLRVYVDDGGQINITFSNSSANGWIVNAIEIERVLTCTFSNDNDIENGEKLKWDCDGAYLAPGKNITIHVTTYINSSAVRGNNINTLKATAETLSGIPLESQSTANFEVRKPNMQIEKFASPTENNPGNEATFIVTVRNVGNADAKNVTVNDTLPANFTLNNSEGLDLTVLTPFVCDVNVVDFNNMTTPNWIAFNITDKGEDNIFGKESTCMFQFDVYIPSDHERGTFNNTVLLTALDMNNSNADGTPATTNATVIVVPPLPSITADKEVATLNGEAVGDGEAIQEVQAGDVLNFSIYLKNNVNVEMINVSINDTLPDCFINLSQTSWSNLSLIAYDSMTVYVLAYVNSSCMGTRYNNSVFSSGQTPDGTPVNDTDHIYLDVLKPNLTIIKWAVDPFVDEPVGQGATVRYYILITNVGRADAKNIIINDTFANGNFTHTGNYGAPGPAHGYECESGDINITWRSSNNISAVFEVSGNLSGAPTEGGTGGQCLFWYDVYVNDSILPGTYSNTAVLNATDMGGIMISDMPKNYTANITVQEAVALTINKSVLNSSNDKVKLVENIEPNQTVNFTIDVCNTGTDPMYNLSVNDTLPINFNFIDCGSNYPGFTSANCSNNTIGNIVKVNWSIIGTVPGGGGTCYEFWVTASPKSNASLINTNIATASGRNSTDYLERSSGASVMLAWPQLTITKTPATNSDRVRTPNSNVTYRITVKNAGNYGNATNIVVRDYLPENFTHINNSVNYVSGNCTVLTMSVNSTNASIANFTINNTLGPGENCTFTFKAYISSNISDGIYTNLAELNYTDLTYGWLAKYYDNATADVRVEQNITISIRKNVANRSAMILMQPGEIINYTITVANTGYNILTNTIVADVLPYGFECRNASTTQGVTGACGNTSVYYDPQTNRTHHTVTWVNQTINGSDAGGTYYYWVTAFINSSVDTGLNTNNANVSGILPNGSTHTKETSYNNIISKPGFSMDKTNSVEGSTPADRIINYTITIKNTAIYGEGTAQNIQINDNMEDNFTFTGDVYNNTYWICNATIVSGINATSAVFNVTNLEAGQECSITYSVRIPWSVDDGTYTNTANVTGKDLANGTIPSVLDISEVTVLGSVEILMTKTVSSNQARLGDQVIWTITVTNTGENELRNTNITDTIPIKGFTCHNVSSQDGHPGNCTDTGAIWYNVTINASTSETFTMITNVTEDVDEINLGINTNYVSLYGQRPDGSWVDDVASAEVTIGDKPRLEVIKSMSQHDVEPGSEPITTIIIQNPTYATIYNVMITDYLPRGFNYTRGTAMLNGIPIDDPDVSGNWLIADAFPCGDWSVCSTDPRQGTKMGLNLTWNWTNVPALEKIPAKSIMVLTFKSHVKCSVCNTTFNNTVDVSGVDPWDGDNVTADTSYEMTGYIANAKLYKYASDNSPVYYDYVDYTIVIWNDPRGANIAPLILNDTLPQYLQYVPGYDFVGDLKIKPTVCGDFKNRVHKNTTQLGTDQGNCSAFGYNDSTRSDDPADTVGETLYWNLSKWLFLTPGQQVSIKYRTQVIPGIRGTAINNVALSYLDPEHPDVCPDCIFYMDASEVIGIIGGAIAVETDTGNDTPEPAISSYTLELNKGWNLISIPIKPENLSISAVLAPIEGKYTDVATWNGAWEYHSYAYGDWFGDLAAIEPKKGYWIYMTEPSELEVTGTTNYDRETNLYGGWNLIGSTSTEPAALDTALSSIAGKYIDVATWNGAWEYRSYAYGDWFGELDTIEPGKGYWINMAEGDSKLVQGNNI
ncbi:hypothetical protein BEH94_02515 [Candidatus Altiarchaeales archaeon WOR_SM1_SCG]|nr:hypothetical protein BEH94_02515 [Candidatus Altiarchaeales archaeon WOR_SM1_SCG]